MKEIKFSKAIIPDEYKRITFNNLNLTISYIVENGMKIQEGDALVKCTHTDNENSQIVFFIHADCDGYFYIPQYTAFNIILTQRSVNNEKIGTIYESMEELCEHEYGFSYGIGIDIISKSRKINWKAYCFSGYSVELNLKENYPLLSFTYEGKSLRLKKGDKLCFCNNSKSYLEFEIITPPHDGKYKGNKIVDFILLQEDINSLIKNSFKKLIIEYKDGKPRNEIGNIFDKNLFHKRPLLESSEKIFHRYVKTYKQALIDVGITFKTKKQKETKIKTDPCFVYLMHDSKNGYHKIGISKTPKYREKTLQSEKPTIDMICAKEYPSRKIAEAIESALHKVYEECRIRGEWFNLSEADIAMLKETLK